MVATIPSRCEIAVVGGGPAGSLAASLLAQQGFDVVLLEKARHPRPNVGESLIPHFWKYTDLVGATEAVESDGFIRKGGGLILWNGTMRQVRFRDFGFTRPGLHVERDRFDHILLENSRRLGVRVFEETGATAIDPGGDEGLVAYRTAAGEEGTLSARYVVDASGQSAVLARSLGLRQFDPDIRFTSLWGYYQGGHLLSIDGDIRSYDDRFDMKICTVVSSLGDWGWVWHITMRDSISVGLVLPPKRLQAFKANKDSLEAKFRGLVAETPLIGDLLRDARFIGPVYGIRDYAYLPTQLAVHQCYLAGDAAAFVDPINSAGVVFGMYAGYLAAWAIGSSIRQPSRSDHFRQSYSKLYGDRLALFRLLAMPADAPGITGAIENAFAGVRSDSANEQKLMLIQAILTCRSNGITTALERIGASATLDVVELPVPAFG